MTVFTPEVVDAVLAHMNGDHTDDNILIVRAFAGRDPEAARMIDLDHRGGTWRYSVRGEEAELHLPWSRELNERPEIRREIVALYDAACGKLGVEPRPHA
ncbi:MAG: DUF2470 domain-containing protein [Protaetiibacter sp.]